MRLQATKRQVEKVGRVIIDQLIQGVMILVIIYAFIALLIFMPICLSIMGGFALLELVGRGFNVLLSKYTCHDGNIDSSMVCYERGQLVEAEGQEKMLNASAHSPTEEE